MDKYRSEHRTYIRHVTNIFWFKMTSTLTLPVIPSEHIVALIDAFAVFNVLVFVTHHLSDALRNVYIIM